jgi:hypothetical protein
MPAPQELSARQKKNAPGRGGRARCSGSAGYLPVVELPE